MPVASMRDKMLVRNSGKATFAPRAVGWHYLQRSQPSAVPVVLRTALCSIVAEVRRSDRHFSICYTQSASLLSADADAYTRRLPQPVILNLRLETRGYEILAGSTSVHNPPCTARYYILSTPTRTSGTPGMTDLLSGVRWGCLSPGWVLRLVCLVACCPGTYITQAGLPDMHL